MVPSILDICYQEKANYDTTFIYIIIMIWSQNQMKPLSHLLCIYMCGLRDKNLIVLCYSVIDIIQLTF